MRSPDRPEWDEETCIAYTSAKKGKPEAMYLLGTMSIGFGVSQNYKEAFIGTTAR